nr:GATOR complex protein WDR59-like isoform X3 [Penaeus vannamei]
MLSPNTEIYKNYTTESPKPLHSVRWSSENVVAEHRDLQATAMALDWRGDYTLLAGRRNLALISLEKPSEIVKRVNRTQQKYDVTAAEWNPKQALGHTFVIASGEKAEICQWTEGSLNGMTTLRAHTRTITDLNWHRFDPHLLVTCSIDTFVHIWDTRETRKPIASLSAIAGASQVKWNKLNPHILASGHDCDVRVWDHRKPGQPMQYIAAHLSKIQGLDWSPNHENHLVTSSNDCTVKFFDILNPRKAENFINTLSPVWRARYTPFGEGVVAVVVPQLRRGENSLRLWSVTDMSSPVHTFVGHSDVVLEFEWRQNLSNPGDYQLVTWARDHSLRIWKIDHQLQKLCGHEMDEEVMLTERTDSDYTSDTTPTPGPEANDVDGDGERRDLVLTNSDTHQTEADNSIIDGCDPDRSSNSNKFSMNSTNKSTQETNSGTPQESEIVLAETVPPQASQTLVSVATPSPTHQVTNFTSTLPAANKASTSVVGLSSTLPAGSSLTVGQPMTLQQEFSLLNTSLDNNQVNSVEVVTELEKRMCQVTAKHGNHTVCLTVNFPLTYPRQHSPTFRFSYGTTIDYACKTELLKVLKNTASSYQRKRKACLEPCIRVFVAQMKALLGDERVNSVEARLSGGGYPGQVYGSFQDHSVPFPRTSGARFCSAGLLVCFARPTFMKKGSSRTESCTPRSLSALGAYITNFMPQISSAVPTSPKYNFMYSALSHSPSTEQNISISNYYYQDKKVKSKRGKSEDEGGRSFKAGNVLLYDIKCLMPFSKELGMTYILDENDLVGTCTHNRDAAAAVGRKDLVQVWSLAAATASSSVLGGTESNDFPWTHHPFARRMINSLLDHYLALTDVQTATMLSCVFGTKTEPQNSSYPRKNRTESNSTGGSPYNTIHGLNMSLEGWDLCMVRHNRSNSEGSLSEVSRPPQEMDLPVLEATDTLHRNSTKFLDCSRSQQYDELRRAYADILYRWGLLKQRAMVLKYLQAQPPAHKGVEFPTDCVHCGQSAKGPQCRYCRCFSFSCSICHVAVKGASNFCVVCGHGGHAYHILEWFRDHNECPTGCGCDCIKEMDHLFK